ncbi:hypothetical protein HDV57DRAFT_424268 [Trichoderma longibrachiatum]
MPSADGIHNLQCFHTSGSARKSVSFWPSWRRLSPLGRKKGPGLLPCGCANLMRFHGESSKKKLWVLYATAWGRQISLEKSYPRSAAWLTSTALSTCFNWFLHFLSHLISHIASQGTWESHISSQAINLTCHVMSHRRHMLASAQAGSLTRNTPHCCGGWR